MTCFGSSAFCVWPHVSLRVTGCLSTRVSSLPSTPRMPDWVPGLVLPPQRGQKVGGEVPGTSLQRPLQWSHVRRAKLPKPRAEAAREQCSPAGMRQRVRAQGFYGGQSHEHPLPGTYPHPRLAGGQQEPSAGPAVCTGLGQGAACHSWGWGGPSPGPSSQTPVEGPPWKQASWRPLSQASVLRLTSPPVPPLLLWLPHDTALQGIDI